MMKIFCGGLGTETNTFSPLLTGIRDFDMAHTLADAPNVIYGSTMVVWHNMAQQRGWQCVFGSYGFAQPAGITVRHAYETLRDALLAQIQAALPLDMVLLTMHGAMVAEGYDDCETDMAQRVRALVGPQVKIGVELDLHCELDQQMLDVCDAIVLFKEYPHIDVDARAVELFNLIAAAAEGKSRPTMALYDCRMVGMYLTPVEPMRSYVDAMMALEGKDGVLSVSLAHSFPWADVPLTGTYTLAITENDPAKAAAVAQALGRKLFALRHEAIVTPPQLDEALAQALAYPFTGKPVVLADTADNAGGGAPSDSTFVLRKLLQMGVKDAALAMMWDPIVVQLAMAAGVGTRMSVRLGGKMGPASGDPLDLSVVVRGIIPNMTQLWPQLNGAMVNACGDSVCLTCDGIDIIVNSKRTQVLGIEVFTNFGLDLNQKRLLVVKSNQHFYAAYAPVAAHIIYATVEGTLNRDFARIPYQRVNRHKYPWLEDPFG